MFEKIFRLFKISKKNKNYRSIIVEAFQAITTTVIE